jgi:TatD DNase family protein
LELAKEHPGFIYSSVGNHPYDADKSMEEFEKMIQENPDEIVAIGETGFDYFRCKIPKTTQRNSFAKHCELALKYNLPVIIHLRPVEEAAQDAIEILNDLQFKKAIFHCFNGTMKMAEEIWEKGWKTSFSLVTTYPQNNELREIFKKCPPELKLVETDSPWLAPQSHRGKRNEPSYLGQEYQEKRL